MSLNADGLCAVLLASVDGRGFVLRASERSGVLFETCHTGVLLIASGAVRECFQRASFSCGILHIEPQTNRVCSPFKMQPKGRHPSPVLMAIVGAQKWTRMWVPGLLSAWFSPLWRRWLTHISSMGLHLPYGRL